VYFGNPLLSTADSIAEKQKCRLKKITFNFYRQKGLRKTKYNFYRKIHQHIRNIFPCKIRVPAKPWDKKKPKCFLERQNQI